MCRFVPLAAAAAWFLAAAACGQGFVVPVDRQFPQCPIVFQRIDVKVTGQAAETRVEQEFRNDAPAPLEAHYCFPLPAKAAVKSFAMTVDGKLVKGEVLEAAKARYIYEDIVRRTKDPGLLEHLGKNLWRVRVFPVPAKGRQKFELTYTEVLDREAGICRYTYPLKSGSAPVRLEGFFSARMEIRSDVPLKSVYSPTHAVGVSRDGELKAVVGHEQAQPLLDRDFTVFWTVSPGDVGLSLLTYRDSPGEPGYFLLLASPRVVLPPEQRVPRDVVFVLDTSGSMREEKMAQAKKALEFCLKSLDAKDRFGLIAFATTVNPYAKDLKPGDAGNVAAAVEWVKGLEANGGTAIAEALEEALRLRGDSRKCTVVFITDGQPTIGETDPQQIQKIVETKNTGETRVFTFGVGDDVNTHLLDQIADATRAASVYVRPKEDLEAKVSAFYDKIKHPVLSNLTLEADGEHRLSDVYPPKLPDLFHGGQVMAFGRYYGKGPATIRLKGKLGEADKEFAYQADFPERKTDLDFVPGLWARRKVGYLLDQIRLRGENAELKDEVVLLAKRFGIATPYTSYLVVPDEPPARNRGLALRDGRAENEALGRRFASVKEAELAEARLADAPDLFFVPAPAPAGGPAGGGGFGGGRSSGGLEGARPAAKAARISVADELRANVDFAERGATDSKRDDAALKKLQTGQSGETAVNLALCLQQMKDWRIQPGNLPARRAQGTTFAKLGRVWCDERHRDGQPTLKVKCFSAAYFRLLELRPELREALALGDQILWLAPSGTALVVDIDGAEAVPDAELQALFVPAKK